MSSEFIFEMKNITKSFGTNLVLDGVTIAVKPGEIRALMGENGAGKSTLMKILGGIYSSDKGEVYFNGVQTKISSVDDARKSGISFIHQEISNIASMTIAENLFLGREPRNSFGFVDFNKMHKDAKAALSVLDMHIDTHTNIEGMSIAQQQMLEVARAISEDAKV